MSEPSSCDITAPVIVATTGKDNDLAARHEACARYRLFWVPAPKGQPSTARREIEETIGSGLHLRTARHLASVLNGYVREYFPTGFFSTPYFGFELMVPTFGKDGTASVGDLVARKIIFHYRQLADGSETWCESLVLGQVTKAKDGKVVVLRDRTGIVRGERVDWVFPAEQFNMPTALAEMQRRNELFARESMFGVPWGTYGRPLDIAHVLAPYLSPVVEVLPTNQVVSRILGHTVDIYADRPAERLAA